MPSTRRSSPSLIEPTRAGKRSAPTTTRASVTMPPTEVETSLASTARSAPTASASVAPSAASSLHERRVGALPVRAPGVERHTRRPAASPRRAGRRRSRRAPGAVPAPGCARRRRRPVAAEVVAAGAREELRAAEAVAHTQLRVVALRGQRRALADRHALGPTRWRARRARAGASESGCSSCGGWPNCPMRFASASAASASAARRRSRGRCGQIVKAATSEMPPPSSTPEHSRVQGADRRRNGAGDQEEQQHSVRARGDVAPQHGGQRDAERDHEQQAGGRERVLGNDRPERDQRSGDHRREHVGACLAGGDRRRSRQVPAARSRPASRTPRARGRRSRSSPGRSRPSPRSRPSVRAAAEPRRCRRP